MTRLIYILWENLCEIAWACVIVAFAFVLVLLLGGCKTTTEKWLFENNNPPPTPDLAAPDETSKGKRSGLSLDSEAVVLPPPGFTNVPITIRWNYANNTPSVFYAYTGYSINSTTNLFGVTEEFWVTNTVRWPDEFERIYCRVVASNVYGVFQSYPAALPDFAANATVVDSIPSVDGQVMLLQSPNMRHWVGYYTRLPVTNAITETTFYRVVPYSGAPATNGVPIELTISELRLWNGTYYGK